MSIGSSFDHVVVVALVAALLGFLALTPRTRRGPGAGGTSTPVPWARHAVAPLLAIAPATVGLAAYLQPGSWFAPPVYAAGGLVWLATLPVAGAGAAVAQRRAR